MDDFKFVRCLNCGWEKNPRKPCFNCGDKVSATMPVTTHPADTELAAAKTRIAELEKALEPFAELSPAIARLVKNGGVEPYRDDEILPVYAKAGDIRRAAALLKEKE